MLFRVDSSFGQVLVVGLGGFLGAGARFVLSNLVHRVSGLTAFPAGTLVVNLTGCLAIGLLGGLLETRQVLGPAQRLFLLVGVLGGFTTFSTFAYETLGLVHASDLARAMLNVTAHVVLGLGAAWLGYQVVQRS